jgi:hypothetical protein
MLTGLGYGVDLYAEHGMEVFLLGASSNGDARGEECDVPYECEAHSETWKMRGNFPVKTAFLAEQICVVRFIATVYQSEICGFGETWKMRGNFPVKTAFLAEQICVVKFLATVYQSEICGFHRGNYLPTMIIRRDVFSTIYVYRCFGKPTASIFKPVTMA